MLASDGALAWDPLHISVSAGDACKGTGTVGDRDVRLPRFGIPVRGLKLELWLWLAGAVLCLSAPTAKPLVGRGRKDDVEGVVVDATFLKMISHSTSSPANTVCSVHRTKTRMLLVLACGIMAPAWTWRLKLLLFEGEQCAGHEWNGRSCSGVCLPS